jgi:superfamily I DNA/RNA helicase
MAICKRKVSRGGEKRIDSPPRAAKWFLTPLSGSKLLEPDEAQLAMTKLQLLDDLNDRIALRFWLGVGSPTWLRGQYSLLRAYCEEHNTAPIDVLQQISAGQLRLARINKLNGRYEKLKNEMERLSQLNISELFDDLFPIGVEWADPIRELVSGKVGSVLNPGHLLDLLRTEITQPEMPAEGDFVRLMSLHKSKGLTSRVAIIVGCIRGLIPFVDDDLAPGEVAAHIEEQRRLFYVALTRAKEILVLSSVTNLSRQLAHKLGAIVHGGNAQTGTTIACEFLHELGPQGLPARLGTAWASAGFQ